MSMKHFYTMQNLPEIRNREEITTTIRHLYVESAQRKAMIATWDTFDAYTTL